jgi:hypothetical protein
MLLLKHLLALVPVAVLTVAGCAAAPPDLVEEEEGESASAIASCNTAGPGICVNQPINAAVECARSHGAVVISYYRGDAAQRCVRIQNGCNDPCHGNAGCRNLSADCGSSPHSRCASVDFDNDGLPATRAQLSACGLRKTTAQHANHYDYVGGGTSAAPPSSSGGKGGASSSGSTTTPAPSGKGEASGTSGATCASATLGTNVAAGACVQRADNSWYVCDASNPGAWPSVSGASDARCTSCPQLANGVCDDAGGSGGDPGGKGGGGK